ncbi:MAG: T9SS type A sorting domain-containing protein, partial [Rhodothermaceae bacterium]|nr:T9SS type A sorting domain-containing protein [Rhodothermaceae bacterium]
PGAITPDATHNARETPVAIQLPDWNAWLPDVHPEDVWEEFFLASTPIDGSDGDTRGDVLGHYDKLQGDLQTIGPDVMIQSGELATLMGSFSSAGIKYFLDYRNGDAEAHVPGSIHIESARQSIRKWTLVQLWDIQQTYALDSVAPEVYGQYGEARSWLGASRQMFDLAPHLSAENKLSFFYQNDLAGKTESTAWYQLQVVVNAGNRINAGSIAPVDWNYHPKHINGLSDNEGGPRHPFRSAQAWMKLIQTFHHDGLLEEEPYVRHAHPGRWGAFETFEDLDFATRAAVFGTLINAYMDAVESHEISEWNRPADIDTPNRWEPASYRPELIEEGTSWQNAHQNGRYADLWYSMIPTFAAWGVDSQVIARMNTWGAQMWPLADWGAIPTGTEGGETAPTTFALEPGFPNPFASTTTLAYTLPEAGPVRMEVFDLMGRSIAVLVDGERTAGRHAETLVAQGLASGTYIVRLQAGSATDTQRVLVMH